jgi:hypothetical protein
MSDQEPAFDREADAPPSFGRRGLAKAAPTPEAARDAASDDAFSRRTEGLPAHLTGTVPDWALGTLGIKAREGLLAMGVTAVLLLGAVAGDFTLGWIYHRMVAVFETYGWTSSFPPDAMPFGAITPTLAYGLRWVIVFCAFAGSIFVVVAMTLYRRGLEAVIGKRAFQWHWGWTLGGFLIPFWNFYRPWVGFAEVRRNAVALAREPYRLERPDFDLPTLLLALVFFLVSAAIAMLGVRIVVLEHLRPFNLLNIDRAGLLFIVTGILRAVWSFALLGYLYSIWSLLQQARIAIIELEPFS